MEAAIMIGYMLRQHWPSS